MRGSEPAQMMVQIRNTCAPLLPEERILPRSRLYDLAPYEIGTPWCESLTGYINRLGWTHHVPPRALVAQEIVPRLDERQRLAAPVGVFGTKWAMSLNGAGAATKPWITVLSHLTSRKDLPLLTLPLWVGDLSPRWQLGSVLHTPSWRSVSGCKLLLEARAKDAFQPDLRCAMRGLLATGGEGWRHAESLPGNLC